MRKTLVLLLVICLALSLCACAKNGEGETVQSQPNYLSIVPPTVTTPSTTAPEFEDPLDSEQSEQEEDLPVSDFPEEGGSSVSLSGSGEIVADPYSWYQKFMNLPIASSSMSEMQLRQLCVDYFRLQLSFTWTPNKYIGYTSSKGEKVSLPDGTAYSGMMYANGDNRGGGNLYKMLNYYDLNTGMLDVAAMGDNMFNILASHCSWGASWAWARVSNDAKLYTMGSYKPSQGALFVGPYRYDESQYDISKSDGTPKIIAANGEQTIYESYAAMKIADGLYSSSAWHVQMCSIAPVVVRNDDGTIDPDASYLHFCDQNAYGTNGKLEPVMQSNGVPLRELGGVDTKVSFKKLLQSGYIPFTIPEFVGKAKVESSSAWVGKLKNGADVTLTQLSKEKIGGNYAISNVRVTVKDASGKELLVLNPAIYTRNRTFSIELSKALDIQQLSGYANGSNTIHITACLSTGKWIEAFRTTLKN